MSEPVWIHARYQSAYGLPGAMALELCDGLREDGHEVRTINLATDPHPERGGGGSTQRCRDHAEGAEGAEEDNEVFNAKIAKDAKRSLETAPSIAFFTLILVEQERSWVI